MLRLELIESPHRAEQGILHQVVGIEQTPAVMRQAPLRPVQQAREITTQDQIERRGVSRLRAANQLERRVERVCGRICRGSISRRRRLEATSDPRERAAPIVDRELEKAVGS